MAAELHTEISYSPTYHLNRVVQNDEALPGDLPTYKGAGINMGEFNRVAVVATFYNSATAADVTPYFWSDEAGAFVADNTPATVTYSGDGLEVHEVYRHPSVYFRVDNIVGGAINTDRVKLEVSGLPSFHRVG